MKNIKSLNDKIYKLKMLNKSGIGIWKMVFGKRTWIFLLILIMFILSLYLVIAPMHKKSLRKTYNLNLSQRDMDFWSKVSKSISNGMLNVSYENKEILIRPYFEKNGKNYTWEEVKTFYPEVSISIQKQEKNLSLKWGVTIDNPQGRTFDAIHLRVEKVKGITWDDVRLEKKAKRIVIKNRLVLDYSDILSQGFSISMPDKRTARISNFPNIYLIEIDPVVTYYPNSTESEGWTVGDIEMQNDLAWSAQTALTAVELDTISVDDDNYVTGPSAEMVTGVQIKFNISEDPSDINNITVLFKGNTTDSDSGEHEFQLYLYNHTAGAWEGPYMTYTGANKGTVNATITVISDFVNSSGDLWAFAGDGAGDGYPVDANIFYGEAKVDYVSAGDTTPPYGNHLNPGNATSTSNLTIKFEVNASDETGLDNITLYIYNSTNSPIYTNSTNITGTYNQTNWTYTFNYDDTYLWSALISDSSGNTNWTDKSNYTLSINAPPTFANTQANRSYSIIDNYLNFSTGVSDNAQVNTIWFQHNLDPTIIDTQNCTTSYSSLILGNGYYAAQSFVPEKSGKIINGSLKLRYASGTAGKLIFEIRTDDAGKPSSTILGNTTILAFTNKTLSRHSFNFTKPVNVTKNIKYYLVVSSPDSSSVWTYRAGYARSSCYSNGNLFYSFSSGDKWRTYPYYDLNFQVYIAQFTMKNETPKVINSASANYSIIKQTSWSGSYNWNFCANDTSNNENCTDTKSLYVFKTGPAEDTINPNVSWLRHPTGKINGEYIDFSCYMTDEISAQNLSLEVKNGTNSFENLYTNTTSDTTIYLDYSFNSTPYANGVTLKFRCKAYDTAGNSNYSSNITLEVDHNAPILSTSPTTNPWIIPDYSWYKDAESITLKINLTDGSGAGMNYTKVDLTNINGTGYSNMSIDSGAKTTGQYSTHKLASSILISTGKNKLIDFYAVDNATPTANTINYSITYSVDNQNPDYESLGTSPETKYAGNNVTHQIRWLDPHSGLDTCIFATNYTGTWANYSVDIDGDDDWCSYILNYTTAGNYSYRFYANDTKDNLNDTGVQLITIKPEPTINITKINLETPLNDTTYTVAVIDFKFNVTNISSSDISSCWISLDGITNQTNSTMVADITTTFTLSNISINNHKWQIICNNTDDKYGYSEIREFLVDTTPKVSFSSPPSNGVTPTPPVAEAKKDICGDGICGPTESFLPFPGYTYCPQDCGEFNLDDLIFSCFRKDKSKCIINQSPMLFWLGILVIILGSISVFFSTKVGEKYKNKILYKIKRKKDKKYHRPPNLVDNTWLNRYIVKLLLIGILLIVFSSAGLVAAITYYPNSTESIRNTTDYSTNPNITLAHPQNTTCKEIDDLFLKIICYIKCNLLFSLIILASILIYIRYKEDILNKIRKKKPVKKLRFYHEDM